MPTKTEDYNRLLHDITNPDKPRPLEHAAKGTRPCCATLEERKKKLGVHVNIYSYMNHNSVF